MPAFLRSEYLMERGVFVCVFLELEGCARDYESPSWLAQATVLLHFDHSTIWRQAAHSLVQRRYVLYRPDRGCQIVEAPDEPPHVSLCLVEVSVCAILRARFHTWV